MPLCDIFLGRQKILRASVHSVREFPTVQKNPLCPLCLCVKFSRAGCKKFSVPPCPPCEIFRQPEKNPLRPPRLCVKISDNPPVISSPPSALLCDIFLHRPSKTLRVLCARIFQPPEKNPLRPLRLCVIFSRQSPENPFIPNCEPFTPGNPQSPRSPNCNHMLNLC